MTETQVKRRGRPRNSRTEFDQTLVDQAIKGERVKLISPDIQEVVRILSFVRGWQGPEIARHIGIHLRIVRKYEAILRAAGHTRQLDF